MEANRDNLAVVRDEEGNARIIASGSPVLLLSPSDARTVARDLARKFPTPAPPCDCERNSCERPHLPGRCPNDAGLVARAYGMTYRICYDCAAVDPAADLRCLVSAP
jgi:hypothetical protein